jgi:hypothetical protein
MLDVLEAQIGRLPRLMADGLASRARTRGYNRPGIVSDDADRAVFVEDPRESSIPQAGLPSQSL